jgi:hypothetical protein
VTEQRTHLVVVDGANVVGSVPDGWWRDRAGAATRLRDALAGIGQTGLTGPGGDRIGPPVEVVLVVEGAARGVAGAQGVRVQAASGSGDDAIVELVRDEAQQRPVYVVTADRGLRERVSALGAIVLGPRSVPRSP